MRRSKTSRSPKTRISDRPGVLFIPGTRVPHVLVTGPIIGFVVSAFVNVAPF
jgi:hypothetical protein